MNARVVVAGAGLAGHEFVRRLLADPGFDGTITWYAAEPGHPYNRVLLTDLLAGRHTPDAISLPALSDPRLTYRRRPLGSLAAAEFDRLVLATGADPEIPPVRGNAVPLRTLNDARTILRALADGARRVAVVGAGPLGVETACALARRGLRVELVHRGPHVLSRWLDAESAALLTDSLAASGITVRCETEVSAATGTWPNADLVVLACGARPRVGLARGAKLPVGRGVLVDAAGRSIGDPRVFAIGDCAEVVGADETVFGAFVALDAARRAAQAIVAAPPSAAPRKPALRLRTYDIPGADVAVLGRPLADPTIHFTDQRRRTRKALTLDGDAPVAAALVGDVRAAPALARAIAQPEAPAPVAPVALLTSPPGGGAGGFGGA